MPSTLTSVTSGGSIHRTHMRSDPRAPGAYRVPDPLPIFQVGVWPILQSSDPQLIHNLVPVTTIPILRLEYLYAVPDSPLPTLIEQQLVRCQGDPEQPFFCLVDLELAVRAQVLWKRGIRLGWGTKATIDRIQTPRKDELELQRLLARFSFAHYWSRRHEGGTVACYQLAPGVWVGENLKVWDEWAALMAYGEGK